MAKGQKKVYSNEVMLKRAKEHMVEEGLSKWTMSKPTAETYDARCREDEVFKQQFDDIVAEHNKIWEIKGRDALNDPTFNAGLYNKMTANKKFMRDYLTIELNEKLDRLLEEKDA